MRGLHFLIDARVRQEAAYAHLMVNAQALGERCVGAVRAHGFTVVNQCFYPFPPREGRAGGVTGAVLLAQSHLAIHTWPELAVVTLDLYTCDPQANRRQQAQAAVTALMDALAVEDSVCRAVERGTASPPF